MHDPEGLVALPERRRGDAEADEVVDVVEVDLLPVHLLVDPRQVL